MTQREIIESINRLYRKILLRDGDSGGMEHALSSVMKREDHNAALLDIAFNMLDSREYKELLSSRDEKCSQEAFMTACLFFESDSFKNAQTLNDAEHKVYSQTGEDGIIQWIFQHIEHPVKRFIEFGVENYTECNTRFLHLKDHFSGLVIDGNEKNIEYAKNDQALRDTLIPVCEFITRDNINSIFERYGFCGEIGLLSIDLDGNDYWIWEAINTVNPQVVICEYNSAFGYEKSVVIEYNESHIWDGTAYYGASLPAFCHLARKKGYSLIGVNSMQFNAFFVRDELAGRFPAVSIEEAAAKHRRICNGSLKEIECRRILDVTSGKPYTIGSQYIIG